MAEPKTELEVMSDQNWHYGVRLSLEPHVIMEGITESLLELDTVEILLFEFELIILQTYKIKSPNYRIKCSHKLHKSAVGIQTIEMEEEENTNTKDLMHSKSDKFTKNELVFIVQIYTVKRQFFQFD